MAAPPSAGCLRLLHCRPWLHNLQNATTKTATFQYPSSPLSTLASLSSSSFSPTEESDNNEANTKDSTTTTRTVDKAYSSKTNNKNTDSKKTSYFPKRGQTLELVCETLAFKGKGVCKVADTGFVVMCDRALPGERFIGRVTRKKDNYAEVTKMKTITPHWDYVEAPCEYASHCGGCKTQNLLYEAQIGAKEQQIRELVVHVGKFSDKDLNFSSILKPIVPCDIQYHYRNKMEFSFGPKNWLPAELLEEKSYGSDSINYALGLHVPGFFYKILNVNKCLLQSEPANKLCKIFGGTHNSALVLTTSTLMLAF